VLAADEPEDIAEKLMPLLDLVEHDSSEEMPVTVLLKGSRFMRMERMMNWLVPTHQESEAH
jgi:UDP-N-acetylmuramyl pentapeptide synthase